MPCDPEERRKGMHERPTLNAAKVWRLGSLLEAWLPELDRKRRCVSRRRGHLKQSFPVIDGEEHPDAQNNAEKHGIGGNDYLAREGA